MAANETAQPGLRTGHLGPPLSHLWRISVMGFGFVCLLSGCVRMRDDTVYYHPVKKNGPAENVEYRASDNSAPHAGLGPSSSN